MKRLSVFFVISVVALAAVVSVSVVQAQDKVATPVQAKQLLSKIVVYAKANGCEKTFNEINKGTMFKIYKNVSYSAVGLDGTQYANMKFPTLVGQNVLGIKDIDGFSFVKSSLDKRKQDFDNNNLSPTYYRWKDSKTEKIGTRSIFGNGFRCGGNYGDVSFSLTYEGKM